MGSCRNGRKSSGRGRGHESKEKTTPVNTPVSLGRWYAGDFISPDYIFIIAHVDRFLQWHSQSGV